MRANLPALPIENVKISSVPLCDVGHGIRVQRVDVSDICATTPDRIIISASSQFADAMITLEPAMIVHLANTMLTDSERAAIHAPAIAGAGVE